MELKFIFFMLLITGSNGRSTNIRERSLYGKFLQRKYESYEMFLRFKDRYIETSTSTSCASPPETITTPSTTTSDPCGQCRNIPISITDTWAGQCFPDDQGGSCNCVCGDVFCSNGETIDRLTCTPDGRLQDCRCIATSTYVPTTVPPIKDPFVGCEWCLNDQLSVSDTFAGYCYPNTSENECYCLCADLFCQDEQIIDRSTCVSGGSIANCRCIDPYTQTSTPEPTTTIGYE